MSGGNLQSALLRVIFSLEETIWHLLGAGSWRVVSSIKNGLLEEFGISEDKTDHQSVSDALVNAGIAKSIRITIEGSTTLVEVKGCALLEVEKELLSKGIEPFFCPVMNVISSTSRSPTTFSHIKVDLESESCFLTLKG